VSAPEPHVPTVAPGSVRLAAAPMDVVELAPLRAAGDGLRAIARGRGVELPAMGRVAAARTAIALCVRPERWLVLSPAAAPGAAHIAWERAAGSRGAAVDLSSALAALHLTGPTARDVLERGCRLDLDPHAFPVGAAAATIMAQVSVVLAALGSGWLLLTPATTARHLREWLVSSGRPFGLREQAGVDVFESAEG
jgi:heterotetrameric sarcosine oxidase gamma subunit